MRIYYYSFMAIRVVFQYWSQARKNAMLWHIYTEFKIMTLCTLQQCFSSNYMQGWLF